MAELIKIDKNGTKHWRGLVACSRCGGAGGAEAWKETGWTCYQCGGSGKMIGTWLEYTPEYEAELEAKAREEQEKWERIAAEREAERKAEEEKREAEHKAEEEAEKARKARSQFVGSVGDKIDMIVTFDHSAYWDQPSFRGYGVDTMCLHCFRDEAGNLLTWKTQKGLMWLVDEEKDLWATPEAGDQLHLKGSIKDHVEYKDEKQTCLTRCKVERV